MKGKLLILCNDLGESIFCKGIAILKEKYSVKIIKRPCSYPTDLKSSNYSMFRGINIFLSSHKTRKIDTDILNSIGEERFDKFLVFGYFQMHNSIVRRVKQNNPNCETIIYFYDSFCRLNFSNDIRLFDKCFTFDREDALNYGIEYLPFFAEAYNKVDIEYEMCHVGSWSPGHLYRLPCLEKLNEQLAKNGLHGFFKCTYLDLNSLSVIRKVAFYAKCVYNREYRMYRRLFEQYKNSSILTKERMSYIDMIAKEAASKCIVEINARRAGLSPRVINALANGRKVIINNPKIRNEIFYNPNAIYIIDEENPKLDVNFLASDFQCLDMGDLAIDNWLNIILEDGKNKYSVL